MSHEHQTGPNLYFLDLLYGKFHLVYDKGLIPESSNYQASAK